MVGYTIAVLKGFASEDYQTNVWSSNKVSVPMAPGLGLILEDVHYDKYNRKFGNDGMHAALTWHEVNEKIENFRRENIIKNIINTETTERVYPFNMYHCTTVIFLLSLCNFCFP